ncbi:hypothetical protein K2173_013687 [Erythroxylum novogranatense]|uniref:Reverse transcriptase domain-containing protein n=1 Tax=Erythroxylum novogranatense TaxID=1862640 RepID=A0AAV8SA90_9ROSI|nr:hypothetical protein K2173_013687 [Erythroxylum novogranatense]
MCMIGVTYNVLLNGTEVGPIVSTRGLRQEDPLSPYLFILLKLILQKYELASSQSVNFQKSGILFSPNVSHSLRSHMSSILGVFSAMEHGKYLGLPSLVGKGKRAIFNYLKNRLWRQVNSWNNRLLSRVGKEVMLKSVAQAIPSYCMSVFMLPIFTCDAIQRMMNSF